MLNPYILAIYLQKYKNIQKVDYMDGFCWQGELDLTLFFYHFYPCSSLPERQKDSVSMLMAICRIVFQVFAFIFLSV